MKRPKKIGFNTERYDNITRSVSTKLCTSWETLRSLPSHAPSDTNGEAITKGESYICCHHK